MLHFGEQLFIIVHSAKHAHCLLRVGDKAGGIIQMYVNCPGDEKKESSQLIEGE